MGLAAILHAWQHHGSFPVSWKGRRTITRVPACGTAMECFFVTSVGFSRVFLLGECVSGIFRDVAVIVCNMLYMVMEDLRSARLIVINGKVVIFGLFR
mmetsp:Transcript_56481/g.150507  ORF Transcript_56481/g.150507 Transcript_56481/m.150507 type:complete len:98 (+) Transcript_56481:90-383(+)